MAVFGVDSTLNIVSQPYFVLRQNKVVKRINDYVSYSHYMCIDTHEHKNLSS